MRRALLCLVMTALASTATRTSTAVICAMPAKRNAVPDTPDGGAVPIARSVFHVSEPMVRVWLTLWTI